MAKQIESPSAQEPTAVTVNVRSEDTILAERIRNTPGLRPWDEVSVELDEADKQGTPDAFPPECLRNKHPEYRFCWVTRPVGEVREATYDHYVHDLGYIPCNRDNPRSGFFKETLKGSGRFRFNSLGIIEHKNQWLMVTHQKRFERNTNAALADAKARESAAQQQGGVRQIQDESVVTRSNFGRDGKQYDETRDAFDSTPFYQETVGRE